MSLHYILDGYNIIKNSDFKKLKTLKDQRYALIRIIKERRPFGSKNNKITVVFDGRRSDTGISVFSTQNIEVVFTKDESADEWIKRKISQQKSVRQTVVITDDKEIIFFSRSYSASVMSVEDFLKRLNPKAHIPEDKFIKPEISFSQMRQINEELKKIWLKEESYEKGKI